MWDLTRENILQCPYCDYRSEEVMPMDRCIYFYECSNCGEVFKPLPGDCCVFCSYGITPCPPCQQERMRSRPLD